MWSGLYRAPAFIAASWKSGFLAAVQAGGLEFVLFGTMAGFTGALTQRFRHYQPVWKQRLLILGVIPLCVHTVEWCGHRLSGTPGRDRGVLISVGMTVLAVAFNWFAMRRGALLAGSEGLSFVEDMKRMPALAAGFLAWIAGRGR